jgi:hypothetical protein
MKMEMTLKNLQKRNQPPSSRARPDPDTEGSDKLGFGGRRNLKKKEKDEKRKKNTHFFSQRPWRWPELQLSQNEQSKIE